jgi:hypothetical protein
MDFLFLYKPLQNGRGVGCTWGFLGKHVYVVYVLYMKGRI